MTQIIRPHSSRASLKMKISLVCALRNAKMKSRKSFFGRPQLCDSPRSCFPPLPFCYLSLSHTHTLCVCVSVCHILTPVCRCGPGHRCRCNLLGPILVLGQIFLHVSACRVCVCACVWACVCVRVCLLVHVCVLGHAKRCLIKP